MKLATSASKPKRINTKTARPKKITAPTKTSGANWLRAAVKTVNKRIHATAAAHSVRSKARKRNRTNRVASQKKSAKINASATFATIIRAPRNSDCGPEDGCGGG